MSAGEWALRRYSERDSDGAHSYNRIRCLFVSLPIRFDSRSNHFLLDVVSRFNAAPWTLERPIRSVDRVLLARSV